MQAINTWTFPDFGLIVKILPDSDCPDPVKDYMEGVERWEIGYRRFRTENAANTLDAFYLRLAQSIHVDFPDYLEGSEHAEKIARKYYAISSDVCDESPIIYLVGLKSELVRIYGCKDAQELIEADADTYRSWSRGKCVGYITEDTEGNEIDSCWGFYSEKEALDAATEQFPTRDTQYYFDASENNTNARGEVY